VVLIVLASAAFALGGALMKAADGFSEPLACAGVLLAFALGAVMLSVAVERESLSTVYVLGLGIEAIAALLLGRYLFGEHMTTLQVVGAALILAGTAGIRWG
jgi:multidrug transporter EmrE-like cation transporter